MQDHFRNIRKCFTLHCIGHFLLDRPSVSLFIQIFLSKTTIPDVVIFLKTLEVLDRSLEFEEKSEQDIDNNLGCQFWKPY